MSKFREFALRHISNGAGVQDGFDVYAVRNGGTEVWAATSGENLSQLQVEIPDATVEKAANQIEFDRAVRPREDDLIHTVGTPGVARDEVYDPRKLMWLRDVVIQANEPGMTPETTIDYLFDTIKFLYCVQIPGYLPPPGAIPYADDPTR